MLWQKAAQLYSASDAGAARELFSAALQYAPLAIKAKNARMLASCHAKLGQHQRAAEYLDIAARAEQRPSHLTQLMRLEAYCGLGSQHQAVEGRKGALGDACCSQSSFNVTCMQRLHPVHLQLRFLKLPPMPRCYLPTAAVIKSLPVCPDFHPFCLSTASIIACKAKDPVVAKEAAALAVQVLIKPDSPSCAQPAGAGALLLHMACDLCGALGGGCTKGCPALPRQRPLATTASACPMCRPGGPAASGLCVCSAGVRRCSAGRHSWSVEGAGCCHSAGYQAHLAAWG